MIRLTVSVNASDWLFKSAQTRADRLLAARGDPGIEVGDRGQAIVSRAERRRLNPLRNDVRPPAVCEGMPLRNC
jgi:hypothetical protein